MLNALIHILKTYFITFQYTRFKHYKMFYFIIVPVIFYFNYYVFQLLIDILL